MNSANTFLIKNEDNDTPTTKASDYSPAFSFGKTNKFSLEDENLENITNSNPQNQAQPTLGPMVAATPVEYVSIPTSWSFKKLRRLCFAITGITEYWGPLEDSEEVWNVEWGQSVLSQFFLESVEASQTNFQRQCLGKN